MSSPSSALRAPSPARGEGEEEAVTLPFSGKGAAAKGAKTQAVVRGFGAGKQQEFLQLMLQGASPQVACKKLKIPVATFWKALDLDPEFAAELQKVWDTLSYNVMAALYQAAVRGNGQAQQFWLKHRPPPRWSIAPSDPSFVDELETLTHAELLERVRAEAPDLAAAIAARADAKRGRLAPETVPGAVERPRD